MWRQLGSVASVVLFSSSLNAVGLGGAHVDPVTAYVPLRKNRALFGKAWPLEWFDPAVRSAMVAQDTQARANVVNVTALRARLTEESPGVFSFPLFTPAFCQMFLDELDNYKATGLPIRRPNSMNRYGLIVNEIGMQSAISELQRAVLQPLAAQLFPVEGSQFDRHHSFMVQYKSGEDLGLDMHTDDSDVTFNVCLGRNFTGATLTVCGQGGTANHRQFQQAYVHRLGRCLVHRGHQRHGADDIATGERNNLIIWNTNLRYRNSEQYHRHQPYEKEASSPDYRCLSYTHDRDFAQFKQYPRVLGVQEAKKKAWCPPRQACYDSMETPAALARYTQAREREL